MNWLIRRVFKRIKQRHPIEVYVAGKLIAAGGGELTLDSKGTTVNIPDPLATLRGTDDRTPHAILPDYRND